MESASNPFAGSAAFAMENPNSRTNKQSLYVNLGSVKLGEFTFYFWFPVPSLRAIAKQARRILFSASKQIFCETVNLYYDQQHSFFSMWREAFGADAYLCTF